MSSQCPLSHKHLVHAWSNACSSNVLMETDWSQLSCAEYASEGPSKLTLIADCLHFCIPLEIVRRILWICARWWRWDNRDSWSAGDAKWPLICHPKSEIKVFIIRNNWITKGCSVWCRLINISVGYAWEVVLCGLVVNHLGWCLHPLYNGLYYILQLLMYLGLGEIYSSGIHEDV